MPEETFIRPQYGVRCFSDIPALIRSACTGEPSPLYAPAFFSRLPQRYDHVVLLYLDAFGWRFAERFLESSSLLKRIHEEGAINRITTQFPSTTAAHITTIHTGQPPGTSGVFEWQSYAPEVDAMVASLLFSYAGEKQRETLKNAGVSPSLLYPSTTLYQDFQTIGVTSYVLQHREYAGSTLSRTVLQGARSLPYTTLPEALVTLVRQLTTSPAPTYHMLYFDRLDGICHHHGPDTPYTDAETEAMLMILDRFLFRPLEGRAHRTLILITADHGQVEVNPKTTVYLNQDRRFAGWDKYLKKNRKGDRFLVPAGAPRDLFLYIHEDRMEEALAFFGDRLEGVAQVRKVRDMIEEEYFGPTPVSERFLARAGDLVILPYTGESVWWYEKDRFEQKFFGHHGGLTRQEMEIPLMFYAFE